MPNVMLDIETLGKFPDAAIISIGAVHFSLETRAIEARFYQVIDLESSVDAGGIMDASTVLWWLQQNEDARKALAEPGVSMLVALRNFADWCISLGPIKELLVWGNGADFDNVILASAYRRMGMALPWLYYNNRCYRTVKVMCPVEKKHRKGIYHNAVDDAEDQALHMIAMLSKKEN